MKRTESYWIFLKEKENPRKERLKIKLVLDQADWIRLTGSAATCSNKGKETGQRTIHLGWLHFDPSQRRYVSVPLLKGGGTRTVSVENDSNVQDWEIHFFP